MFIICFYEDILMIFDSIILKLKGIMYLVYFSISEIHLFIFLLKVANFAQRVYCVVFKFIDSFLSLVKVVNFAQRDKHHLFREIYIFCSYFIVMGTSETLAPAGEWVSERKRIFIFLS